MNSEVEHIHASAFTTSTDELTAGILSLNSDRRIVAHASLGKTSMAITRGNDGKVRIEIDDTSDEDVYVSINAQAVTVTDDDAALEKPWHPPLERNTDMTNSEQSRSRLAPITGLLSIIPVVRERPKMQYRLGMSRKNTGMNGEYENMTDVIDRIQRYEQSFPGEIIGITVEKI